jgi:hypothetical protein
MLSASSTSIPRYRTVLSSFGPEQQLDRSQIAGLLVNLRRLGAPHRMPFISRTIDPSPKGTATRPPTLTATRPAGSLRSIITRDGTLVRCRPIAEIQDYLVDVTPPPAFGWVIAFDDRVPRLVEVSRGMTVRRVLPATDMAAGPAQAQMQPPRPYLQTFLAAGSKPPSRAITLPKTRE